MQDIKEIYERMEKQGWLAPVGECEYCDNQRANLATSFPGHQKYSFCRSYSGGRHHCTCDTCF